MSFLWHPIRTFREYQAASPFQDAPIYRMIAIAAVYVIGAILVFAFVSAIVSSEIGYGNARCAFADCKVIYVRTR